MFRNSLYEVIDENISMNPSRRLSETYQPNRSRATIDRKPLLPLLASKTGNNLYQDRPRGRGDPISPFLKEVEISGYPLLNLAEIVD